MFHQYYIANTVVSTVVPPLCVMSYTNGITSRAFSWIAGSWAPIGAWLASLVLEHRKLLLRGIQLIWSLADRIHGDFVRTVYLLRAGHAPEAKDSWPNDSLADGQYELLFLALTCEICNYVNHIHADWQVVERISDREVILRNARFGRVFARSSWVCSYSMLTPIDLQAMLLSSRICCLIRSMRNW